MNTDTNNILIEAAEAIKHTNFKKLIDRIKEIALKPKEAWPAIKAEDQSIKSLYFNYLIVCILFTSVMSFISNSIIGHSIPYFGYYRVPLISGLLQLIIFFCFGLAMAYGTSLLINFISKQKYFSCEISVLDSLKILTFTYLLGTISSALGVLPGIGILLSTLVGFYSIYVFYLGVKEFSNSDKSIQLTIAVFISLAIIIFILSIVMAVFFKGAVPIAS